MVRTVVDSAPANCVVGVWSSFAENGEIYVRGQQQANKAAPATTHPQLTRHVNGHGLAGRAYHMVGRIDNNGGLRNALRRVDLVGEAHTYMRDVHIIGC